MSSGKVGVSYIIRSVSDLVPPSPHITEKRKPKGYWQDINNRRKVLTEFAEEMGFDPTVYENWRKVPFVEFVAKKVSKPKGWVAHTVTNPDWEKKKGKRCSASIWRLSDESRSTNFS